MNCPICNRTARKVNLRTIGRYYDGSIKDQEYFLCVDPDCKVAYFSDNQILNQSDISVSLWHKNNVELFEKIICYCRNITYKDIYNEMSLSGNPDFVQYSKKIEQTGPMRCSRENIASTCCGELYHSCVVKIAKEIDVQLEEKFYGCPVKGDKVDIDKGFFE